MNTIIIVVVFYINNDFWPFLKHQELYAYKGIYACITRDFSASLPIEMYGFPSDPYIESTTILSDQYMFMYQRWGKHYKKRLKHKHHISCNLKKRASSTHQALENMCLQNF